MRSDQFILRRIEKKRDFNTYLAKFLVQIGRIHQTLLIRFDIIQIHIPFEKQ